MLRCSFLYCYKNSVGGVQSHLTFLKDSWFCRFYSLQIVQSYFNMSQNLLMKEAITIVCLSPWRYTIESVRMDLLTPLYTIMTEKLLLSCTSYWKEKTPLTYLFNNSPSVNRWTSSITREDFTNIHVLLVQFCCHGGNEDTPIFFWRFIQHNLYTS